MRNFEQRRSLTIHLLPACIVGVICMIIPSFGATEVGTAAQQMETGKTQMARGVFGQAAISWTEAAKLYESEGKAKEQTEALLYVADALQQMGQYRKAITTLEVALRVAESQNLQARRAVILNRLGNAHFSLGLEEQAASLLTTGLELARAQGLSSLTASLLNDLGNVYAAQRRNTEAIGAYAEGTVLATATNQPLLAVTAEINSAMTMIQDGLVGNAKDHLDLATLHLATLGNSREKAMGYLNIGLAYYDLRAPRLKRQQLIASLVQAKGTRSKRGLEVLPGESPSTQKDNPSRPDKKNTEIPSTVVPQPKQFFAISDDQLALLAGAVFSEGERIAKAIGDHRTLSYALGHLGHMAEESNRRDEALRLTRAALFEGQQANAPESLYRWHWQIGRILKQSGQDEEALTAYKRAVQVLQPIRHEFSGGYQGRHNSFQESVKPLFTEISDLILRRAATLQSQEQAIPYLMQARETIETFKAAELQDYFRDECVKTAHASKAKVEHVAANTMVIYPIILPDRLELLVSHTSGMKRIAVDVLEETLTQEVRAFRRTLQERETTAYLRHAQQLYSWLIHPLEEDLQKHAITTVVFVPDGPLRTIPMAALHDGTQHLIARYAIAVTPGMELTDARPMNRNNVQLLSMGLTDSVQDFPPLPNVEKELSSVRELYGGEVLLNRKFVVPAVETQMKEHIFSVMHIASHGVVEDTIENSFVLAYDDKITMDRLAQMIGVAQFRKSPLELLTLSACETAVGDDRAALGLAGMAVKAGARSALATLWFIDDEATSQLISEFYRQLKDPMISKAVALQRAQLKIQKEANHTHPSFWSPFLLINNWL